MFRYCLATAAAPACQGLVLEYAQKMISWRMNYDDHTLADSMLTPDEVIEHNGSHINP